MDQRRTSRGDAVPPRAAVRRVRREAPDGQGHPDRGVDDRAGGRVHRGQRRARQPARLRRLPVYQLPDLHDAGRAGRGPALRPVGRNGQDRVRHPRLTLAAADLPPIAGPALVAVAHGSRDPRAAATVSELLEVVSERARGLDVRAAFLDHSAPSLPQALGSLDGQPAVVVPLLLTAAYHSKTDIPARLAAATAARPGQAAACAGTLGPHPLLTAAL